jgi:hypothetical protein
MVTRSPERWPVIRRGRTWQEDLAPRLLRAPVVRVTAFFTLALALAAPTAWADPPALAAPVETARASPDAVASHSEITGWVSGGLGAALIGGDTGSSKGLGATLGVGRNLFSLRYRYSEEIQDCGQTACGVGVAPLSSNTELAFEYGVQARSSVFLATASVGLSALWITERGDTLLSGPMPGTYGTAQYNAIRHFTVGATWELGAYLSSRFISFGPTLVLTADAFQSSAAILVDLHLGYVGKGGD